MDVALKGFLQGSIPVVVFVGGAHHFTKKLKTSKPVLYYGSLLAGLGLAYAVVEGKIKAPFMNAEDDDLYYCSKCDEGFSSINPTDEGQFCDSCLPSSATLHDEMERITMDAETFENCEVCYATVDKGTLNDVQAGRICDECYQMNKYAGGTGRQNNPPFSAETFEAEKMSPCCEEPLIEREGIFCGACGENYGFSAETFEADKEYLSRKEDVAGLDDYERYQLYDDERMTCDECGADDKTVGFVEEGYKLCGRCDREWMAKQGYEAEYDERFNIGKCDWAEDCKCEDEDVHCSKCNYNLTTSGGRECPNGCFDEKGAETFEARENKDGTIVLTENEWYSCLYLYNGNYLYKNKELKLIGELKSGVKFEKVRNHSDDALKMIHHYENLLRKMVRKNVHKPNKVIKW